MSEFVAFDESVEVLGAAIMSVSASLGERAKTILNRHHLTPLERDNWYKQQAWLDAFQELSRNGFGDLVAIGMKIPDEAAWPPDVQTVHDALASIDVAYQMNHRGGKIGGYYYEATGENSGIMTCDNPYPSDFDYGIIYRTIQKFRQTKGSIMVHRENIQSRKTGHTACVFHLSW